MSLMPVVDVIRAAVPVPTGVVRDDTGAEPMDYGPDRLYVWADAEVREEDGTGGMDEGRFTLGLALTLASAEASLGYPERATSVTLDTGMDAIATWVRNNRSHGSAPALWEDLQVTSITYGGLRGFEHRGHRMSLAGTRQITS